MTARWPASVNSAIHLLADDSFQGHTALGAALRPSHGATGLIYFYCILGWDAAAFLFVGFGLIKGHFK
jgi:hypothetical protein